VVSGARAEEGPTVRVVTAELTVMDEKSDPVKSLLVEDSRMYPVRESTAPQETVRLETWTAVRTGFRGAGSPKLQLRVCPALVEEIPARIANPPEALLSCALT